MPPRRSSRAPSVAAESTSAEVLPGKRKRGGTVDPEAVEVAKPPSRARRSASVKATPAPTARKSSRTKVTLPDVPESGDEDQLDAPPVKKARPSIESGNVDGEEEEHEEVVEATKPRRARRAASVITGIEADQPSSKPTSRRTSTRSAAVSSGSRVSAASTRSGGASSSARIVEEDEEEEIVPPSKTRGKAKSTKRAPSRAVHSEEEEEVHDEEVAQPADSEEEYEEESAKPARKGRKAKAAPAPKSKNVAKEIPKVTIEDSEDDNEEEFMQPVATQYRTPRKSLVPPPTPQLNAEQEEEEEQSLFDPPPIAAPAFSQPVPEEPNAPKHRLVIHKMALVNFKSYAGRQEIGPFHKSFSSIVGPNGSGKSNTIDALLFVFGYRASKMRQGKVSELIHTSASYPNFNDCSVEVHFRDIIDLPGPDAFKVVPNSSLIVTRTAFKNNSSKYTINGKTSNYAEVQTLLKGRGIDLDHNRFLILQGEVESIAQMKPKGNDSEDGLLEYLEDIIGTSEYKKPIEEALVKLEELSEIRQGKLNKLRHVEKEKLALVARKKEAEDYLRMKNEHIRALSRHYQFILQRAFDTETKNKVTQEKLKNDLSKEREKHKGDIEHLEALQDHYAGRAQAYDNVKRAASDAVKELAAKEREEIGLQERRKHASGRAKKLKKSVTDETAAKKAAERMIQDSKDKLKKEKSSLEQYEIELEAEEQTLAEIRDSLKDKTQVFHDKINIKQQELQPWTAQINTIQAEIDVAISERDALAKKAEALKAQCDEADTTLKTLQDEIGPKIDHQNILKNEKGQLAKNIQAAEQKIQEAQLCVNEWKSKASSSRGKVEEARSNQSENRSRNAVLDALNRLKDTGKIPGFHGRLGNLGTIPDKYDVAISTACGGALNHLVVDRVSEAQQCIEYLRKNNIGRASFTVLEKIEAYRPNKADIPENAPRLFDLVKPKDPKFIPAFYKAIRDTLVATDMDQANRLAFSSFKRWRVVTLDGGLIEASGAMSGGGNSSSRGAMSSKFAATTVSPQVLRQYEQDNEVAAQQLQKALQDLREAEHELESLKARGPKIDLDYQKLGMDIENTKARIAQAEKRVKELGSQNKPNAGDLSRISKLEKAASSAQKQLDKLVSQSAQIEQDIKDLEKKILDVGGSKLLHQKSKVEGIQLHIELANNAITQAEVNKSKAEKDVAKLGVAIETNTAALEEVTAEVESLEMEIHELQTYVENVKDQVTEAREAAENKKEEVDKLKAKLDAQRESVAAFRSRELKIEQDITEVEKELSASERTIEDYSARHDALALEEIDEDDEEEDEVAENPENAPEDGDEAEKVANEDGVDDDSVPVKEEGDEIAVPKRKDAARKSGGARQPLNELRMYLPEELKKFKIEELVADVAYLDEKIKKAKPDLAVLKEYKQREQDFFNRAKELDKTTAEKDAQKELYDKLQKKRLDEFMDGFREITLKVKEMYQMITIGGNAELEPVDSLDPFSEGIIFSVMPPKKSWKNISNLSGGEKTLSSLALVFALHHFKPTPLYFMDEIDAALDFRNVSIIANYIKDRTKNAQFIIISLRNDMFELSHRLIGIYKTSNATRTVTIDNHALQTTIPRKPAPPPTVSDA